MRLLIVCSRAIVEEYSTVYPHHLIRWLRRFKSTRADREGLTAIAMRKSHQNLTPCLHPRPQSPRESSALLVLPRYCKFIRAFAALVVFL